jgi:hypothetical protein
MAGYHSMKSIKIFPLAAIVLALAGCASSPVVLAPVGPNPDSRVSVASEGALQVFSRLVAQSDDQNQAGDGVPAWYQHSDYDIYDLHGKRVKHVDNAVGHYDAAPRVVTLPPGQYIVVAASEEALQVNVPVEIERGRMSRVHLDDHWKTPANSPRVELVRMPSGNPVGWSAAGANEGGHR